MDENRLFAYLDILGFKDMIKTRKLSVPTILKKFVSNLTLRRMNPDFDVIYFSDTILFYSKITGCNGTLHDDIITLSRLFIIEMLRQKIPVRGVITYGEFNVDIESSSHIKLFWGQALIDAHEAESTEDIIGLFILPEAFPGRTSAQISAYMDCHPEDYYVKYNDRVIVNLFSKIAAVTEAETLDEAIRCSDPGVLDEIIAYYFLEKPRKKRRDQIERKYQNTLKLAHRFIGHRLEEMKKIYDNLNEYMPIYQRLHNRGSRQS